MNVLDSDGSLSYERIVETVADALARETGLPLSDAREEVERTIFLADRRPCGVCARPFGTCDLYCRGCGLMAHEVDKRATARECPRGRTGKHRFVCERCLDDLIARRRQAKGK